ncbi:MAG: RNA 3'-terminal phosphate cyclase [Haloplanus sp.]
MLTVDGSAGGGQMLRTALSLAAVDDRPVRVESVRGDRPTPGLRAQHLAAVRALAALTDADVTGSALGSETVTFDPGPVVGGESPLRVDVGTAGSVALVCDALLPLAARLDAPQSVVVAGGTDVKWSPPVDYLQRVKLPLFARFGLDAGLAVERRGFYPAGGGAVALDLAPSTVRAPRLSHRGAHRTTSVHAVASESLADADVGTRLATAAVETLLARSDAPVRFASAVETTVASVPADSPGCVVLVRLGFERTLAGFSALGERGVPAETVGADAATGALSWLSGRGVVDPQMADQLLVLLALVGGAVVVPRVTDHVATGVEVVRAFGRDVDVTDRPDGSALVSVAARSL